MKERANKSPALSSPLIAAIVAELPAPGTAFPGRESWSELLQKAFDVVYPDGAPAAPVGESVTQVQRITRRTRVVTKTEDTPVYFSIDPDGFAMRNGKPVSPEEIPAGAEIIDERVDGFAGDLDSIMWKSEGARAKDRLPPLNIKIPGKAAA